METFNKKHFNNPVVIVLLLILLFVGGYLLFSRNTTNNTRINGQNYYLEHGDFSVYFPEKPTYSLTSQELTMGNVVSENNYSWGDSVSDMNVPLEATYINSPFANSNLTPEENLKNELEYGISSNGSELISSNPTTFHGFPAIDYVVFNQIDKSQPALYGIGRDILKGNDLYSIQYVYQSGQENKQLENTFLNSLTFSSPSQNSVAQDSSASNFTQAEIESLKQQLKAMQNNNANTSPPNMLPSVIQRWSSSVALIACTFTDNSFDFGSGFLTHFSDGSTVVITNKHVITDETTGYSATRCAVKIPGDENNIYTVNGSDTKISSRGYDWGVLPISNGDTYFTSVAEKNLPICRTQAQTGDNVIVLGYPDYAGNFTWPTATQGIVSGYADPYYTTSAKIEAGNSGGVALNSDKDCYMGIPSAVQIGKYDNLGRILSAKYIFQQ